MWTEATMPFSQSIIVSGMGVTVVFLTLVTLALAIMAISRILRVFIKDEVQTPAAAAVQPVISDEADKENLAVLMATIGLDLDLPPEQFKIVDVKEVR